MSDQTLIHTSPLVEGINPRYIINFLNACELAGSELHGILIARNNHVIFEAYNEPYRRDIPHIMHSFTKLLTNTAFALAYDDGLVSLDDPLLKYFPEYADNANAYLKACTLHNMITMRNGQERSIGGNEWRPLKTSWKDAYFQVPFDKQPGSTFMYSSGNSYILSYIVQMVTGKTAHELFWERIGSRIGMNEFTWMRSPEGVCSGGNGVMLTAEDMLRIGLLYANKGKWNGQQLISEKWIEEAFGLTHPIAPIDGVQYNFHWEKKGDIYSAKGMFGQVVGIAPAQNIVFAFTAADQHYCNDVLFQKEVVDPLKAGEPVPEEDRALESILVHKGLRMTLLDRAVSVPEHINLDGAKLYYQAEENKYATAGMGLTFSGDEVVYTMEDSRGHHEVRAGLDHWISGTTTLTGAYLHHQYDQPISRVVALAYWRAKNTLIIILRYPEMAFCDHLIFTWEGKVPTFVRKVNMNSQETEITIPLRSS